MSESYWWCPECHQEIDGSHVTFEEFHDTCGAKLASLTIDNRPLTERISTLAFELACARQEVEKLKNEFAPAWRMFREVALALKCLPSSFADGNDHVLRKAHEIVAELEDARSEIKED
jgi:hypothetical protein